MEGRRTPTTLVEDGRRGAGEEGAGGPPPVVGLRLPPDVDGRCCRGCGCPREVEDGGGCNDADDGGGGVCDRLVDAAALIQQHLPAAAKGRLCVDDVDVLVDDGGCRVRAATTMMREEQTTKRLVLVLDLDHTLLHTIAAHRLTHGEAHLLLPELPPCLPALVGGGGGGGGGVQQQMLFNLVDTPGHITKLRPFVRTFLREASTMYHLCICTMGTRTYAQEMARLLDPEGAYFTPGDNIFAREDFTGRRAQKALDVVRRGDERTTVILDDTPDVWGKHVANLIRIPEYHYFAGTRRVQLGAAAGPAWAELRRDEDEAGGELAWALHLLRHIHRAFFLDPRREAAAGGGVEADPAATEGDVRDILKGLTRKPGEIPFAAIAARWRRPPQHQLQVVLQCHQLQACRT